MTGPIFIYHQVNVILAICAAFFTISGSIAVIDAYDLIRWLKRRRSRPVPAWRTPAAEIRRPAQRPDDPWMDPIMPDENEIRRYGPADYGPPHIEPAQPGPTRTRPARRGLLAAGIAALAVLLVAGIAGGAWYLGHRSSGGAKPQAAVVVASSTPPVRLDSYARLACQKLDTATQERESGDQFGELHALMDETAASSAAIQSSVGEMATIAKQELPDSANYQAITAALRDWCTAHWSPGQ